MNKEKPWTTSSPHQEDAPETWVSRSAAQKPRNKTTRALSGDRMPYSEALMAHAAAFGVYGGHASAKSKECIFGRSQTPLKAKSEASELNL